ncbi:NADP-dependent oxidoreductase [Mucilaginibacter polytrichastri]|nr:NADP-dependent oxidoreductase [Mucilaginibacter polytrichastri]
MKSKIIKLAHAPHGLPRVTDFKLEEEPMVGVAENELWLKPLYFSVDPYLRAAMAGEHPPLLHPGDVIVSRAIAEVIESTHKGFKIGDIVTGYMEWRNNMIRNTDGLNLIEISELPLSAYLGVLGTTGLSAYFALKEIGKPKQGETIVVSGAAGAVGSIAGQIGKLLGCRVIGIVGNDEKANYIQSELGFDGAINYKTTPNIEAAIIGLCKDGVDVYFDNVGGEISDGVIARMNNYGRVVVCGSIANYNDTAISMGPRLLPQVVFKKLLIQGFLIGDYKDRFAEGRAVLQQWLKDGKIKNMETIVNDFDKLPEAFIGLFTGKNEGKMIVKI